jgi:signal peptide peptidase SppA
MTFTDLLANDRQGFRQFRRMIRGCVNKPLLYHAADGYGAVLFHLLERVARGERVDDGELDELMADSGRPLRSGPTLINSAGGQIALVSVRGIANYDIEFQPYAFSTLRLVQTVREFASDPQIRAVVLDIDSPGGEVTGTSEAADAVYAARQRKPVVALVNPLCASAAYWIASQCSAIVASSKHADVGSIGVFLSHVDCSEFNKMQGLKVTYIYAGEHKVEGNPDEPLSDTAAQHYQGEVDAIYRDFLNAVARGRGIAAGTVRETFGKGRTMMAPDALRVGMIDGIGGVETAISLADPAKARAARLARLRDASRPRASPAALTRRQRLEELRG